MLRRDLSVLPVLLLGLTYLGGCVQIPGSDAGSDSMVPPIGGPGAPVLSPVGDRYVPSDEEYRIFLSATDPEPGPQPMGFSVIGTLPEGARFDRDERLFTWTPTTGDLGRVVFVTFAVTDGAGEDRETIAMTVIAGGATNHPPIISPIGDVAVDPGQMVLIELTAIDPDGDPLQWRFVGPNPGNSQLDPVTGVFSFTPNPADAGLVFPVTFEVDDSRDTTEETFRIFVDGGAAANHPPTIAPTPNQTVAAGDFLFVELQGADPDGDPLTWGIASVMPAGASFDAGLGRFAWMPDSSQVGFALTVIVSASDGVFTVLSQFQVSVVAGGGGGGGGACVPDPQEPNDDQGSAIAVTTGVSGASICGVGDRDWWSFSASAGDEINVVLTFVHALGDIDLFLMGPGGVELDSSETVNSPEAVTATAPTTGTYYAVVRPWGSATNSYDLNVSVLSVSGCSDDGYEPNDSMGAASIVSDGLLSGLQVCSGDDDWYAISVPAGADLIVTASFVQSGGDLDLALYDPSGALLDTAYTSSSNEVVSGVNLSAGMYAVKVFGFLSAENAYSLDVDLQAATCVQDGMEPNNSTAAAPLIAPGTLSNLAICGSDSDYFAFTVPPGGDVDASISFVNGQGDLDLWLLSPTGSTLDSATTTSSLESVSGMNLSGGTYYLKIAGWAGAENDYDLTLTVTTPAGGGCTDDGSEPNDAYGDASRLFGLSNYLPGLQLCSGDEDWFVVFMYAGETLDVAIDFLNAEGDLDLYIYGPSGTTEVGSAVSVADGEATAVPIATTGDHFIRVVGYSGAEAGYDLSADVVF